MVKVYRASECELVSSAGYGRKYLADVVFRTPPESAGFILVKISGGIETDPHAHKHLEEAFIIMNKTRMGVGDTILNLEEGDVVLAQPGEPHWFIAPDGNDVTVIAIKFPNLKQDKILSQ